VKLPCSVVILIVSPGASSSMLANGAPYVVRWPAMAAPFSAAYGALEPYGPDLRARAELYDLYVPLAAIASFRENERPDREEAARDALREWLEREA